MMILQDILGKKDHIAQIESWAEAFGFANVRLYYDVKDEDTEDEDTADTESKAEALPLQLVVANNPDPNVDQYPAAFEAMLSDKFQCQTSLIIESAIKPFFKQEILENSLSIRNLEFGKNLSNINIAPLKTDTISQKQLIRAKQHAERILESAQVSKKTNTHPSNQQEEKLDPPPAYKI